MLFREQVAHTSRLDPPPRCNRGEPFTVFLHPVRRSLTRLCSATASGVAIVLGFSGKQDCQQQLFRNAVALPFLRKKTASNQSVRHSPFFQSLLRVGGLLEGLSEPEFYGDLVYKFRKIIGKNDFPYHFKKIIVRYKKIGYNLDVLRQTACLVVNPIKVNSFAYLFNCTTVGRASD